MRRSWTTGGGWREIARGRLVLGGREVRLSALFATLFALLAFGSIPGGELRRVVIDAPTAPLPPGTTRPASLHVHVKDAAGHDADHAEIHVYTFVQNVASRSGDGTADDHGALTIAVPEGDTWLVAEHAGVARASTHLVLAPGERARDVEMTLGPERFVEVEVVDEKGAPMAGAELEVTGADPLPVGARTDARGAAHVGRVAGERLLVVARALGYEEATNRSVRAGDHVRLVVKKLGALMVQVVQMNGAPSTAAHVRIAGSALWPARSADVTAADGVRVSSLPAGSYALEAWDDTNASPIELGIVLGRGEEKRVVLRLTAGIFATARVLDGNADDAAAIPGARVSVVEAGLSPFPREAISGADGRVRVGPFARGDLRITAQADGFVPAGAVRGEAETGETKVALLRGGELRGRVVDTRGMPIAGATIEVVGTDLTGAPIDEDPRRDRFRESAFDAALAGPPAMIAAGELGVMPGPVPPIPHVFGAAGGNASAATSAATASAPATAPATAMREPWVTRGDGTFRAAPLPPGRMRARVHHPQYVEASSEIVLLDPSKGAAEVTVVLSSGGALEGRVVDENGRAVAGGRVTLAATQGTFERTTRTASDGTFAFASVPESATLLVSRDPMAAAADARMTIEVPERGRRDVVVNLPEARPALHVRVTDDRGYPVTMAQLSADSLDPAAPLRTTVFTDARGEADLAGARGVHLRIEARAPSHATARMEADGQNDIGIVLGAGLRAVGEVRGSRNGLAIVGADVLLYADDGPHRTKTGADGRYSLGDLPTGAARLQVHAAGYAPKLEDVTLASDLPRVELDEEAVATGQVVDERGDPVAGARVAKDRVPVYLAMTGAPAGVVTTDAKGRFKLGELPDGETTLEAYAADVGRGRVNVHLYGGSTTSDVRIALVHEGGDSSRGESAGSVAVTLGERTAEHEVVIVAVADGSQAERAGLMPNDVLLDVDGQGVGTIEQARTRLTGPMADDVVVRVRRGERSILYRLAREVVRR